MGSWESYGNLRTVPFELGSLGRYDDSIQSRKRSAQRINLLVEFGDDQIASRLNARVHLSI